MSNLIDPCCSQDTFAEGLARIENLDGAKRLVFSKRDRESYQIVVQTLVLTTAAFERMRRTIFDHAGNSAQLAALAALEDVSDVGDSRH